MTKIKKSILNKILIGIILIASIFAISNITVAATYQTPSETNKTWGSTRPNMPAADVSGSTGMFPQYWTGTNARIIELQDSRLTWMSNNKWKATITGNIVYCGHHGNTVRFGEYDAEQHFLRPGNTTIQGATIPVVGRTARRTLDLAKSKIEKYYKELLANSKYYTNPIYDWHTDSTVKTLEITEYADFKGGEDAIAYFLGSQYIEIIGKTPGIYAADAEGQVEAEADAMSNMSAFFEKLVASKTTKQYSSDTDTKIPPSVISATQGPLVIVMEQSEHTNDGYAKKGAGAFSNNQLAFIHTALENVYGQEEYCQEYSLQDIQTAYWLALGQDPGGKATAKGRQLFQYATDYANFVSQSGENYNASINASQAQVIADRENGIYTIGPFWVNYPEYVEQDISYVKSLSINNGQLIYDETHNHFSVIMETGGTTRPGANGLMKAYPKNGEKFFIQFSASSVGEEKSVDVGAQFEYLSGTTMNYERLEAQANVYQYFGYSMITDSEYRMAGGTASITVKYKIAKAAEKQCTDKCHWVDEYQYVDENGDLQTVEGHTEHDDIWVYYNDDKEILFYFAVFQPYIQMGEEAKKDDPQPFDLTLEGERVYTVVSRNVTTPVNPPSGGPPPEKPVNLTMELGGYVWEDAENGKESIINGLNDKEERRIPNVVVTLSDGQTTKTDANGEYRFYRLDPMKQYSVTFTYNGQYYQPTNFEGGNTWGTSNWAINSNAKDNQNERKEYNLKFEKIGSSPENYVGSKGANRTYTKAELLSAEIIDEFGNLVGNSNESMVQYVKDCMINAYTFDLYPIPSIFVIDNKPVTRDYNRIIGGNPPQLYDDAYYINLGLVHREESDLAIKKDVDHVTLEINGQKHTYTYDTLENKENAENQWDISVRLSDHYYDAAYTRELYKEDYLYKVSNYGENFEQYGKTKQDELDVYITYKIMVRNQATSIRARVDELVDYYDNDLEYIDERSYIDIKQSRPDAMQKGIYSVKASDKTRYSNNTETKINGYDNLYITGLSSISSNANNNYLAAGQTAYVYLTFKVKKDAMDNEDWVRLDEEIESGKAIGVGKENIVEVNGYSTQYPKGATVPNVGDVSFEPAGIVDRDSNSGNLADTGIQKDNTDKSVFEKFEDDTDKAPNIRIILNRDDNAVRVISGNVWEDERTDTIGVTTTGDGIRDNKDKNLINGVTVQLVELMENGTEYVWKEFGAPAKKLGEEIGGINTIGKGTGTGTMLSEAPIINNFNLVKNYEFAQKHDGQYAFKSFMPGKYVVRFIYGDTVRTVTPSALELGGLNEKSYNGQDYKSTTYQEGITQNKTYTWREKSSWNLGQETLGNVLTQVPTFKQDASNNETVRTKDETGKLLSAEEHKGYLYDITASDKLNNVSDAKDIESIRNKVIDYSDNNVTNYIAEVLASHKVDYSTMNNRDQLLNDLMANTKMTAETGMMVIELEYDTQGTNGNKKDNSYKIQNVDLGLEERAKSQIAMDKEVTNVKVTLANGSILFDAKTSASNVLWKDHKPYNVGYKGNFLDESKFGSIENIRNKNANKFGLIQLTMDEELMHGATIEITYQVKVSNVGEVDYKDNLFYYTGNKSQNAKVVTTKVDKVIDYVANNLQFNVDNNKDWKVIEKDQIKSEGLINEKLKDQLEKYNTIIVTDNLNKELVPTLYKEKEDKNAQDSVSVPLVLTQLITAENDSDDLTYRNLVEIVKTSNDVGRRMEYSVVGNQDPTKTPQEIDTDTSEVVRILPPFGSTINYYIIGAISIIAVVILIGGIIFIKKKVLRK